MSKAKRKVDPSLRLPGPLPADFVPPVKCDSEHGQHAAHYWTITSHRDERGAYDHYKCVRCSAEKDVMKSMDGRLAGNANWRGTKKQPPNPAAVA